MPEHPYSKNKYIAIHRYSCECMLGRFLNPKEIPHHINNIKSDNCPENLYLFQSNSAHISYHQLKNKVKLISNLF